MSFLEKHFVDYQGSTRGVGLMRIFIALALWSRWGAELAWYNAVAPDKIVLSTVFWVTTTLMLFGVWSRLSTALTACTLWFMSQVYGLNWGVEAWTHHHTNLLVIGTTFLAMTDCGRSLSMDRAWALMQQSKGGPTPVAEWGSLLGARLIGLQISTLYLWSAWDKTSWDFISGGRLENLFLYYYWPQWPATPLVHEGFVFSSVFVVAAELVLPIVLWMPSQLKWALPFVFVFHGMLYLALPVNTFTVTMYVLMLAFVPPAWVHDGLDQMLGREPS